MQEWQLIELSDRLFGLDLTQIVRFVIFKLYWFGFKFKLLLLQQILGASFNLSSSLELLFYSPITTKNDILLRICSESIMKIF